MLRGSGWNIRSHTAPSNPALDEGAKVRHYAAAKWVVDKRVMTSLENVD